MPKKSLYLSNDVINFIGEPENLSGRVNSIIMRYQTIIAESCPTLSVNEWLVIMDANNGCMPPAPGDSTEIDPARFAWMNVADSESWYVKEMWKVDNLYLARKMKSMSFLEQCAVMDVISKFWSKSDSQHDSYRAQLEYCGARIS